MYSQVWDETSIFQVVQVAAASLLGLIGWVATTHHLTVFYHLKRADVWSNNPIDLWCLYRYLERNIFMKNKTKRAKTLCENIQFNFELSKTSELINSLHLKLWKEAKALGVQTSLCKLPNKLYNLAIHHELLNYVI